MSYVKKAIGKAIFGRSLGKITGADRDVKQPMEQMESDDAADDALRNEEAAVRRVDVEEIWPSDEELEQPESNFDFVRRGRFYSSARETSTKNSNFARVRIYKSFRVKEAEALPQPPSTVETSGTSSDEQVFGFPSWAKNPTNNLLRERRFSLYTPHEEKLPGTGTPRNLIQFSVGSPSERREDDVDQIPPIDQAETPKKTGENFSCRRGVKMCGGGADFAKPEPQCMPWDFSSERLTEEQMQRIYLRERQEQDSEEKDEDDDDDMVEEANMAVKEELKGPSPLKKAKIEGSATTAASTSRIAMEIDKILSNSDENIDEPDGSSSRKRFPKSRALRERSQGQKEQSSKLFPLTKSSEKSGEGK